MGGDELKWRQLAHHQLTSQLGLILVYTVKLKLTIKAQISGRMVSSRLTGFYLEICLGGEARHFNQRTSYVTNMQLLSIKHYKRI